MNLTLDQLEALVGVANAGGFTAAGKRLNRVQSSVSQLVAAAEDTLGLVVFDRSTRPPTVTPAGQALLADAREVLAGVQTLSRRARSLIDGLEPEVSIVFDGLVPTEGIVDLCRRFQRRFPEVALRVGVETLASVPAAVAAGAFDLGVVGPDVALPPELEMQHLGRLRMTTVAAPGHPLAELRDEVVMSEARRHVQIVLVSRTDSPDVAVVATRTWRVTELHVKHALIRAGLGWGNLPEPLVMADLASGALKKVRLTGWGPDHHVLQLAAVWRAEATPGPAVRWLRQQLGGLGGLCADELGA